MRAGSERDPMLFIFSDGHRPIDVLGRGTEFRLRVIETRPCHSLIEATVVSVEKRNAGDKSDVGRPAAAWRGLVAPVPRRRFRGLVQAWNRLQDLDILDLSIPIDDESQSHDTGT